MFLLVGAGFFCVWVKERGSRYALTASFLYITLVLAPRSRSVSASATSLNSPRGVAGPAPVGREDHDKEHKRASLPLLRGFEPGWVLAEPPRTP